MRFFDILAFSFANFFRRKARSLLTVLGVVIGTISVVVMLSVGIGLNVSFEEQMQNWGNIREISVFKKWSGSEGDSGQIIGNMDDESFEKIRNLPHVMAATPNASAWFPIIHERTIADMNTTGILASEMKNFDEFKIHSGRLLDESDVGTYNFVMVYEVPYTFKSFKEEQRWFDPYETPIDYSAGLPFNPVGQTFKFTWDYDYGRRPIDTSKPKHKFIEGTCVGVLISEVKNPQESPWFNSTVYMDVKGVQSMNKFLEKERENYYKTENNNNSYGKNIAYSIAPTSNIVNMVLDSQYNGNDDNKDIYDGFRVIVDERDNVLSVESEIKKLGFEANSSMTWIKQQQEQSQMIQTVLGVIGAVSFLVAAISIANTMIMSIYERTREIGIMKVIGCKVTNVRTMFLVEAGIIGFIGGIFGVGLSYVTSILLNKFLLGSGGAMGDGAFQSVIPIWLAFFALVLAIAVGVVSGLYPAIRATRLSALEAIKNE